MKRQRMKSQKAKGGARTAAPAGKRRLAVGAAALLLIAALAALAWARPLGAGPSLWLGAGQAPGVSLTLRATGFEPSSVTQAAGPFALAVSNQSGAGAVTLHLYRSSGERLQVISVGGGGEWSGEVSLAAGYYVLVAPDNPAWSCRLAVE